MGGVNGSTNSQATIARDSIMLDLDLDEMADEWASLKMKTHIIVILNQNWCFILRKVVCLQLVNLIFCHDRRIIKANILYLQRLQETFWQFMYQQLLLSIPLILEVDIWPPS